MIVVAQTQSILSSHLVYNLMRNIQGNNLDELTTFVEYGHMALESVSRYRPFQKLLFLVRDWEFKSFHHGFSGGKAFLDKRLQITEKMSPAYRKVRMSVRSCFDQIDCFLMPHPGKAVAESEETYSGDISAYDYEFRVHLEQFVFKLLHPDNLLTKNIAGTELNCKDLLHCFKEYVTHYNRKYS